MFFEGFTLAEVAVPDGTIRLRHGGSGPPLLLLHGNPQTHAMWHLIAPTLAERFHVICPDLRGYGFSHKPPATGDHMPYSKREMAKDMVAVMDRFDHRRFLLAGHDRGGSRTEWRWIFRIVLRSWRHWTSCRRSRHSSART